MDDRSLWNSAQDSKISPNLVGRRLGNYTLRSLIAQGGMGAVYEAFHEGMQKVVALKTLLSGANADKEEVQRFLIEARVLAQLDHPNVVPVLDVGEINGVRYMAMELIRGQTLYDRIRTERHLDPDVALDYVRQAAEGLQHAHDIGVLHRDLKPANILIDPEGRARLTDFGVAKATGNQRLTATGTALGTPNYMSPEQAMGKNQELDARTDVYGLGAILYECLTGLPPFNEPSAVETMQAVVRKDLVNPRKHNPKIPIEVEALCLKCLRKNRDERFLTARALVEAISRYELGDLLSDEYTGVYTASSLPRTALTVGVGALVVALVAFSLLLLATRPGRGRESERLETQAAELVTERLGEAEALLDAGSPDPKSLSAVTTSLDYEILIEELLASSELDPAAARDAVLRGLGQRDAYLVKIGPTVARAKLALAGGGRGTPSHEQVPALVEALTLAPNSPAGQAARLALVRALLAADSALAQSQAVRELRALSELDGPDGWTAATLLAELHAGRFALASAKRVAARTLANPDLPTELRLRVSRVEALARQLSPALTTPDHHSAAFSRDAEGPVLFVGSESEIRFYRLVNGHLSVTKTMSVGGMAIRLLLPADWTGDGNDELLVISTAGAFTQVLALSLGEVNQPVETGFRRAPGSPLAVAAGDVDGDGRDDLALLMQDSTRSLVFLSGPKTLLPLFPPSTRSAPGRSSLVVEDLDGDSRAEVYVGTRTARGGSVDVRTLSVDGSGFESRTIVRTGPVASLQSLPGAPRPRLLVTVDWEGQGPTPEEEEPWWGRDGILVLAQPAKAVTVESSWSYPGSSEGTTRLLAWPTAVGDDAWVSRAALDAEGRWAIDMRALADLTPGSMAPPTLRLAPPWTAPPFEVTQGDLDGDGDTELLMGNRLLGAGPPAADDAERRSPSAPPSALQGARLLRALGHPDLAQVQYVDPLESSSPLRAQVELEGVDALLVRAREASDRSARAFEGNAMQRGVSLHEAAVALYADAARASQALAQGATAPRASALAWSKAAFAQTKAGDRPGALESLTRALALESLPPETREALESRRLALRRWLGLRPLELDLVQPKGWAQAGLLRPLRSRFDASGATITCSNEALDALLMPVRFDRGLPLELEATVTLDGGAWLGVAEVGVFHAGPGGDPSGLTGFRLNLSDTARGGPSCELALGGRRIARAIPLPWLRGTLNLSATFSALPAGGVQGTLRIRDGEGQLLAQRRLRDEHLATPSAPLALGIASPTTPFLGQGCVEHAAWPMSTHVTLKRLTVHESEPRAQPVPPLWTAHAALARGDVDAALNGYQSALTAATRTGGQRTEALWYRGLARGRKGMPEGSSDVLTAATQDPHWALLRFEDLAAAVLEGDARDRTTLSTALNLMAASKRPILVALSRNLAGALDSQLPSGMPGTRSAQAAAFYLGMRNANDPQRWRWQQGYQALSPGARLPRKAFPRVLSLPLQPPSEAEYLELLAPTADPLEHYARVCRARAARPQASLPRLRLAALYRRAELLGETRAELRGALGGDLSADGKRSTLIRLASACVDLGATDEALETLEAAKAAGANEEQLLPFRRTLGDEPRFKALLEGS